MQGRKIDAGKHAFYAPVRAIADYGNSFVVKNVAETGQLRKTFNRGKGHICDDAGKRGIPCKIFTDMKTAPDSGEYDKGIFRDGVYELFRFPNRIIQGMKGPCRR